MLQELNLVDTDLTDPDGDVWVEQCRSCGTFDTRGDSPCANCSG